MPITTVRPYFTGYCLHRSLCCGFMLPMQLAIVPSSPRKNITGGEFLLAGQRSYRRRAELVQGEAGAGVFAERDTEIGACADARTLTMRERALTKDAYLMSV